MKREFLIDRQGKSFVLYAGLLDEAHQRGLKSMRTQMLQLPGPDNGNCAICYAEVEMEGGRTFTGIADATQQNVGRQVAGHFIRMAETRAKARALRDAINIGSTALEELGDDDAASSAGDARDETVAGPGTVDGPRPDASGGVSVFPGRTLSEPTPITSRERTQRVTNDRADLATQAQVRAIYLIGRDQRGMTDAEVEARSKSLFGAGPGALTRRQASRLITTLKGTERSAAG